MKSIKTLAALLLLAAATGCSSIDVVTDTGSFTNVAANDYRGDLETDPIMRSMASDSLGE